VHPSDAKHLREICGRCGCPCRDPRADKAVAPSSSSEARRTIVRPLRVVFCRMRSSAIWRRPGSSGGRRFAPIAASRSVCYRRSTQCVPASVLLSEPDRLVLNRDRSPWVLTGKRRVSGGSTVGISQMPNSRSVKSDRIGIRNVTCRIFPIDQKRTSMSGFGGTVSTQAQGTGKPPNCEALNQYRKDDDRIGEH